MTASVTRWRKSGNDRLYVSADDGTKLGYRDLSTGLDHLLDPDRTADFVSAVDDWLSRGDATAPTTQQGDAEPAAGPLTASLPGPLTAVVPTQAGWDDLAGRRAGAMAREQAVALKEAAPIRTLCARVLGVHTDERAWRIGADGEEKVAAQLEKLARKDPRWQFLHAVPIGDRGSDIDHVVIGPGGVFTLNAKHHPGAKVWVGGDTVMVNGQRLPYVHNSRSEAARAGKFLSAACGFPVIATGVVVPVGADDVTVKKAPTDVHVVYRLGLAGWLAARAVVLTDVQSEAIFAAARRSTTWTTKA